MTSNSRQLADDAFYSHWDDCCCIPLYTYYNLQNLEPMTSSTFQSLRPLFCSCSHIQVLSVVYAQGDPGERASERVSERVMSDGITAKS